MDRRRGLGHARLDAPAAVRSIRVVAAVDDDAGPCGVESASTQGLGGAHGRVGGIGFRDIREFAHRYNRRRSIGLRRPIRFFPADDFSQTRSEISHGQT
jgi:hypothetical protein